jgi:hypothetical protein
VNPFPKWEIKGVLEQTNRCPRKDLDAESLAICGVAAAFDASQLATWKPCG